jgi:hypothetical protein
MDAKNPCMGQACHHHCTFNKEVVAFGGTMAGMDDDFPPSPTRTLAFGGLNVTYLALDIMEEARV